MTTTAQESTQTGQRAGLPLAGTNFGFLWCEDLDAGFSRIAEAGVTRTELMVSLPHVDLRQPITGLAHRIIDATDKSGLALTSLNPVDMNLISANAAIAESSLEQLLLTIDLASEVGAPTVVVVPGKYNALVPMDEQRALDTFRTSVEAMLPRAADRGIKLGFENVPFGFLESPRRLWSELLAFGTDIIGLTIDAANMHFIGDDIRAEIEAVRDHILLVHVSDTGHQLFAHGHIGDGSMNFTEVASVLKDVDYRGDTVYELATPGVDWPRWRNDLNHLRELGWT